MADYQTPDTTFATFNQAGFQMYRVHQIMSQVNLCWTSLTGETDGVPNHLVLFNCLCAFFMEVRPSFTDAEGDEIQKELDIVEKLIDTNPLWINNSSSSLSGSKRSIDLNLGFFTVLKKELRAFQTLILKYAGKHNLLNPNKGDPRHAVISN